MSIIFWQVQLFANCSRVYTALMMHDMETQKACDSAISNSSQLLFLIFMPNRKLHKESQQKSYRNVTLKILVVGTL